MFAASLITFRETLEAVLVVGIVLTFLTKTNLVLFKKFVWTGVGVGIVLSLLLALGLELFFGGLEGRTEELFEGILMFVTAIFLTWMITLVHRQKDAVKKLKEKIAVHAQKGYGLGIAVLVASSIFREGTETVLYLRAGSSAGASQQVLGGAVGILLALALGYIMFRFALRINLSLLFNITGFFLLLFAAGLVAHGVHEFQELGFLPIFSFDPLWNISNVLDHNSAFGSFLRILFGYTSKPTTLELASYAGYILALAFLEKLTRRIPSKAVAKVKS